MRSEADRHGRTQRARFDGLDLALTSSGQVRYALKTPYRNGTTHLVLEPLDLLARLAVLVPPPRMHPTRYHGVFAPHRRLPSAVTPAGRGMGAPQPPAEAAEPGKPPTPPHVAMIRARRLKRVFRVDIGTCARCGWTLEIIACIEEPRVVARIPSHLQRTARQPDPAGLPLGVRARRRQVKRVHDAVIAACADAEVKAAMAKRDNVIAPTTREQAAAFFRERAGALCAAGEEGGHQVD